MKHLILLILLAPCAPLIAQSSPESSYQEGLDNCMRIREEQTKENPGSFAFVTADCLIGSRAPEFSAITLDGNTFNTHSLKGKVTIINFWMISCPPCIAEIPGLNNVVEKYGRKDFNFVAIGMDDEKDITEFLEGHPWHFDQVTFGSSLILDDFKMRWGFPTTFVLDQNGVIIGAFSGGKTDESAGKEIEEKLSGIIAMAAKGK